MPTTLQKRNDGAGSAQKGGARETGERKTRRRTPRARQAGYPTGESPTTTTTDRPKLLEEGRKGGRNPNGPSRPETGTVEHPRVPQDHGEKTPTSRTSVSRGLLLTHEDGDQDPRDLPSYDRGGGRTRRRLPPGRLPQKPGGISSYVVLRRSRVRD